jgi:hypothetical protein
MDRRGVRMLCGGQARLPRHVFALVDAHDGIVGYGQVGLNQIFDRTGWWWVMPIFELAAWSCPLPHAAWAGARQRISPSRRP